MFAAPFTGLSSSGGPREGEDPDVQAGARPGEQLARALVVATVVYPTPVGQAFDSAAEGAVFGLFPIM